MRTIIAEIVEKQKRADPSWGTQLEELILNQTSLWAEQNKIPYHRKGTPSVVKEKKEELSEKGKQYLEILRGSAFGQYEEGLVKVLAAMEKEPGILTAWKKSTKKEASDPREEEIVFLKGVALVCTSNPNSHNYPENEVVIVLYEKPTERIAFRISRMTPGNRLPGKTSLRPASEEEIQGAVARIVANPKPLFLYLEEFLSHPEQPEA